MFLLSTMCEPALVFPVVFWLIHLCLSGKDIRSFTDWLSFRCSSKTPPDPWAARLETGLDDTRISNWRLFSRVACFFSAGGVSYWMYSFYITRSLNEAAFFIFTIWFYVLFKAIAKDAIQITPGRVRFFCSVWYLSLAACLIQLPFADGSNFDCKVMDVQLTAIRFVLSAVAIDTKHAAPWQALLSACQIWSDFKGPGGLQHPGFSIFLQIVVLGLALVMSAMIEAGVRANIRAQFNCSDAESLMFSFRSMLRGLGDGEVLLDSNLRIHGEADCLQQLLMTSKKLEGRPFVEVLHKSDHGYFKDFLALASSQEKVAAKGHVPPCLRVSLLHAVDTWVHADIYHVPIAKLYGSHEPYHLIAFKEDSDSRKLARAGEDVEAVVSANQASGVSVDNCPELAELFAELEGVSLLVDTSTSRCSARQMNLKFPRQRSSLSPTAPALRSMVLPADWPTVYRELERYAQDQEDSFFSIRSRFLPALACQLTVSSSARFHMAQTVEMSAHRGKKVWLRLGNFAPFEAAPANLGRATQSRSRSAER